MNLRIGKYLFQVVWWGWRWNVGYWRWPPLETRQRIGMRFGFHGVYIGPVEFRFHQQHYRS